MNQDIVLDITEIITQQKESKGKRFRIAVLAVGILVLAALIFAAMSNGDNTNLVMLIGVAALLVALLAVFTYGIPSRTEKKFLAPYISDVFNELESRGYKFADVKKKATLTPWFSSQSSYLYGKGLALTKSMDKGLKMRQIKFDHKTGAAELSVERIMTKKQTLLHVVSLDGKPIAPVLTPDAPVLKTFPPVNIKEVKETLQMDANKVPVETYKTDPDWDSNSLT